MTKVIKDICRSMIIKPWNLIQGFNCGLVSEGLSLI